MGTRPGLTINRTFERLLCEDAARLKRTVLDLLDDAGTIIPAHGAPLSTQEEADRVRALLRSGAAV
ncbi:MAG: hypothetical protein ACFB6R_09575 [Alphaproteobacteria bacterium]